MTAKVQGHRVAQSPLSRRFFHRISLALALLAALLLTTPGGAWAQMYQWTDAEGRMNLTDNPYNIPSEYAEKAKAFGAYASPIDDSIPLTRTDAGYIVTARLNGQTDLKLLLDTGANVTVLSPGAFKKGGQGAVLEKEVRLLTAGGETRARSASIASLAVGNTKNGPMTVVVHDAVPGYDGLLGMDYLGRYHFEIIATGPKLRLVAQ